MADFSPKTSFGSQAASINVRTAFGGGSRKPDIAVTRRAQDVRRQEATPEARQAEIAFYGHVMGDDEKDIRQAQYRQAVDDGTAEELNPVISTLKAAVAGARAGVEQLAMSKATYGQLVSVAGTGRTDPLLQAQIDERGGNMEAIETDINTQGGRYGSPVGETVFQTAKMLTNLPLISTFIGLADGGFDVTSSPAQEAARYAGFMPGVNIITGAFSEQIESVQSEAERRGLSEKQAWDLIDRNLGTTTAGATASAIPDLASLVLMGGAAKGVATATGMTKFIKNALGAVGSTFVEGATEGGQKLTNDFFTGVMMASDEGMSARDAIQSGINTAFSSENLKGALEEAKAGWHGAAGALAGGSLIGAIGYRARARRANQAKEALMNGLQAVARITGDKAAAAQFISGKSGIKDIYIDANRLVEESAARKKNSKQVATDLGASEASYDAAVNGEGRIRVDADKFFQFMSDDGFGQSLLDNVALSEDGLTVSEVNEVTDLTNKEAVNVVENVRQAQEISKQVQSEETLEQGIAAAAQAAKSGNLFAVNVLREGAEQLRAKFSKMEDELYGMIPSAQVVNAMEQRERGELISLEGMPENEQVQSAIDEYNRVAEQLNRADEVINEINQSEELQDEARAVSESNSEAIFRGDANQDGIEFADDAEAAALQIRFEETLNRSGFTGAGAKNSAAFMANMFRNAVNKYMPDTDIASAYERFKLFDSSWANNVGKVGIDQRRARERAAGVPESELTATWESWDNRAFGMHVSVPTGNNPGHAGIALFSLSKKWDLNASTVVHEFSHHIQLMLRVLAADGNVQAATDLKLVEDAGREMLANWNEHARKAGLHEESLGNISKYGDGEGFPVVVETYLRAGYTPDSRLLPLLEFVRSSMEKFYQIIKGTFRDARLTVGNKQLENNKRVIKIMDELLGPSRSRALSKTVNAEQVANGTSPLFAGSAVLQALQVQVDEKINAKGEKVKKVTVTISDANRARVTKNLVDLGMTEIQASNHIDKIIEAQKQSTERVAARVRSEVLSRRNRAWKAEYERQLDVAYANMTSEGPYRAAAFLRDNEMPIGVERKGPAIKLNRAELIDAIGEDSVTALGDIVSDDGMSLLEASQEMGFNSPEEMVDAVTMNPDVDAEARARATAATESVLGPFYNEQAVANEVSDAMNGDARGRLLRDELRILHSISRKAATDISKRVFSPVPRDSISRQIAEDTLNAMPARDVSHSLFKREHDKHARLSAQAFMKGDIQLAAHHKQKQITNFYLMREARSFEVARAKLKNKARQLAGKSSQARMGKSQTGILEHVNAILTSTGLAKPRIVVDPKQSLGDFVNELRSKGFLMPEGAQEAVDGLRQPDDMTVSATKGLLNLLTGMSQFASTEKKVLESNKSFEMERARRELLDQLASFGGDGFTPDQFRDDSGIASFKKNIRKFLAQHIRMEFALEFLDRRNFSGPFRRHVWDRLVDAKNKRSQMTRDHSARMDAVFDRLGYDRDARRQLHKADVVVPSLGNAVMSKANLISLFLNMGNEGNLQALVEGGINGRPVTEQDIIDAVNLLDKKDLDLGQAILDEINSFRDEAFDVHQRVTGIRPEAVAPRRVITRHGEYAGGYYPIAVDKQAQPKVDLDPNGRVDPDKIFGPDSTTAMTAHGYTKQRQGTAGRPLLLTLNVADRHIQSVIHDISHREAVVDTVRLLRSRRVGASIENVMGPGFLGEMEQWLVDIAQRRKSSSDGPIGKLLDHARRNYTAAALALNTGTAISQFTGAAISIEHIGPAWFARGMAEMAKRGPVGMYRRIAEISPEMRDRLNNGYERDVREMYERNKGAFDVQGVTSKARDIGMNLIGMAQMMVDLPTWQGAYEKAMAGKVEGIERGDHDRAVAYGDSAVRESQSAADLMDLPGISRKTGALAWMTMFSSFFSVQFNKMYFASKRVSDEGAKAMPAAIATFGAFAVTAVLEDLVRGRYSLDEEDRDEDMKQFLGTLISGPFNGVIGVRDLTEMIKQRSQYGRVFGGPPLISMVKAMAESAGNVAGKVGYLSGIEGYEKYEDLSDSKERDLFMTVGALTGLPALAAYKTYEGLFAAMSGEFAGQSLPEQFYRTVVSKKAFGGGKN